MNSQPVFQATPVRPTRQPSQHQSRPRADPHFQNAPSRGSPSPHSAHGGSGYDERSQPYAQQQQGYDDYRSNDGQGYYDQQTQQGGYNDGGYNGARQDYGGGASYVQEPSSSDADHAWGTTSHALVNNGSNAGYTQSLRHRTGESISYSNSGSNDRTLYQPPAAPFMDGGGAPRAHPDNDSVFSQYNKGWDSPGPGAAPLYPDAASSTAHLNAPYPDEQWNQGPGGYGGGHEAIPMNHAPPGGFAPQPGFPPSPNPQDGGFGYGSDAQGGFAGGFVGLAAPGTILAQPQPQHLGQYRDPGAYEATRQRILRKRTVKRLELTRGNLVVEVPIAASICKKSQAREFTHCRYTAATCDPDNFVLEKYSLRPWMMGREIELAIVLTSYNEDEVLLTRTLNSVIKNIGALTTRAKSKTWGSNGWTKVVVIMVADGRTKADKRFLKLLQLMGVYHEGVMVDHVNEKPTTAHLFELTTQVMVSAKGAVEVSPCPIQVLFCLKEKNAKKINSHRWFFNAFCNQLKPNVCILLDVGTKPAKDALYHLWKAFSSHPKVGGACGEITVDTGRGCGLLLNPLVAAQNFEYKMSNILDKPLESVFGYITVLPGAFSAYRFKALQGRPLEAYFKGEKLHSGEVHAGSFLNNMYLAEDRILCFELVAKANEAWLLKYVKSARASTDVPDRVPEFISQRRRWLNGSLFAAIYSTYHFYRLWTSGQSFLRKLLLQLQTIYSFVNLVFAFTGPANFYLATFLLIQSSVADPAQDPFGGQGDIILQIVQSLMLALIVVCLILSLGNRPQGSNLTYTAVIFTFAVIMGLAFFCAGWSIYRAIDANGLLAINGWSIAKLERLIKIPEFRDIVISLAATYLLYVISSLIHLDPWHLLTCFPQYLLMTPTFVIVLAIYSLSNTHDISWGTKGDSSAATDLGSAGGAKGGKDGKGTTVEVKAPSAEDAEQLWSHAQAELVTPRVEEKSHRSASVKSADAAANFRTNLLLIYCATNAALIIWFTSPAWYRIVRRINGGRAGGLNPYMTALFWATAGLSAVRALGSLTYILLRMVGQ